LPGKRKSPSANWGFFISFPFHKCRHPERSEGSQRCIERHESQPLPTDVILSEAQRSRRTRANKVRAKPSKAPPVLAFKEAQHYQSHQDNHKQPN
jgi:hypothetical protein